MANRRALVFEASRDGYAIDQIADEAMTVGELKEFLAEFEDDVLIVLSHDRGYTYGSLNVYTEVTTYEEVDEDEEFGGGKTWEATDW